MSIQPSGLIDIIRREGQDEVPGPAFFIEIDAEDLSTGKGHFVEGEDHFCGGFGGGNAQPVGIPGEDGLFVLEAAGDVLVLAGDTLPLKEFDSYKQHRFFDWCADNFKQTFLVPGNHEYYRDDISKYSEVWRLPLRDNVAMYENGNVIVDDTEFILSTLWSHIPMNKWLTLKAGMSDFSLIKNGRKPFTATTYNELHEIDLEFIKMAVSQSKASHKVVVTHHVPSRLLVAPEFVRSNLECGFTVDLTDYIADSGIDLWVYGHSHRSIETVIGRTRMASNQVGYVVYGEHAKSFSGDKVVDLDFPTDNIPEPDTIGNGG